MRVEHRMREKRRRAREAGRIARLKIVGRPVERDRLARRAVGEGLAGQRTRDDDGKGRDIADMDLAADAVDDAALAIDERSLAGPLVDQRDRIGDLVGKVPAAVIAPS